jgi:diphthine-ammonia ligase
MRDKDNLILYIDIPCSNVIYVRLAALTSGGKDSVYALYLAMQGGHRITDMVTIKPSRDDSFMFHSANIHMVDLISRAADIPLTVETSMGEKEKELKDLKRALSRLDVEGVTVGAIESKYQADRVYSICKEMDLEMVAPLWHLDPERLIRDMIRIMDVRIVHVSAMGLNQHWLGRKLDPQAVEALIDLNRRYGIHICGEGGEYETLVLNAPFFRSRIEILDAETIWDRDRGIYQVKDARLEPVVV